MRLPVVMFVIPVTSALCEGYAYTFGPSLHFVKVPQKWVTTFLDPPDPTKLN